MASKSVDTTTKPASNAKRPPGVPIKGGSTKEAKDLRELIQALAQKNSPETSKDITAYAKQTLKIVAQSQKAESAAFRREATKALFDFRTFVEKSEKVTEARRSKLLSDIDSVSLDAKSATLMMLSVAKEQSKTIKMTAQKEALVEKMKAKQNASLLVEEAKQKAKAIGDEVKLKSKALSEEQTAKFKAMKQEMILKHKNNSEQSKIKLAEDKEKLKVERVGLHEKYDKIRVELADQKAKLKLENEVEKDKIKQSRKESAQKFKELKSELKSRQEVKNQKQKTEIEERKSALKTRTAERFQKLRLITQEHKERLKKVEEESKSENLVKKAKIKSEIQEINDKYKERQDKAKKNADELTSKVKDGIYDANPMIHAAVQIFSGVFGMIQKRNGEKKKQKELNRLQHRNTNSPNQTPNPRPANPNPTPGSNQNQNSGDSGGGFFGSILSMIPSVTSVISGIVGFFKTIGSSTLKLGKLMTTTKAIPIVGAVVTTVMAIFDFLEGFNNASKLFGEKVEDENYVKRIFSGFVNVFSSIIGIFDTVAGWLGFDTDLKGMYEKAQVKMYNKIAEIVKDVTDIVGRIFDTILGAIKSMAGTVGSILEYVPGAGGAAKALKAFSGASTKPPEVAPVGASAVINSKQNSVNDLQDQVDTKKAKGGQVQIATDNSIKTNTTTIVTAPLSTRNNDKNAPGYITNR